MGLAVLDAWWVTAGNLLPRTPSKSGTGSATAAKGDLHRARHIPGAGGHARAKGMIPVMDPNVKLIWNFQELTDHGPVEHPKRAPRRRAAR